MMFTTNTELMMVYGLDLSSTSQLKINLAIQFNHSKEQRTKLRHKEQEASAEFQDLIL